ncbi:hypothetical protein BAUCODRAFT_116849 [Baudoinia panamericana UAMH 10762]|uniref:Stress response RCI peptide n=1 Tax=Baudoinia panamericana (strain UAMH 10762) TaxID=717646 RepID=M2LCW2_BAUPA|nr:uncharacterized protein BAUCODRAFT_116849 [Baudoinia panamericana UAMH 10762]EMC91817.1 hypothetical protein BAUCODRAFT_116849 [Baudoinia panamericana UAMH 10762]
MCGTDIFLGLLAILFPPLAVWVKKGLCSADSLINLALCCLGFLPGLLHAWYIIAVTPDPTYSDLPQQDPERGYGGGGGGNVTYYYVQQDGGHPRSYGTVGPAPSTQFPHQQQGGFVQPPPPQQQVGGSRSEETPPTYQQAVQGDNKVQRGGP